ncbi:Inactive protein kinase, partial [Mucuna pruriens]
MFNVIDCVLYVKTIGYGGSLGLLLTRSRLVTVSDQREVSVNSCSQMVLQLHQFYDPYKIKIRIKILSASLCGAVAAEAKRAQSSWVILDKKLKNEKKFCMEEICD